MRRSRRWWLPAALAALALVATVSGTRLPASADAPGPVVEVSRAAQREDGRYVVVSALVDSARADAAAVLDQLLPGSEALAPGDAGAAFVLWRRWTAAEVPLTLAYNGSGAPLDADSVSGAVQDAMASWNSIPGQWFRFALGGPAATDTTCDDGAFTIGWRTLPAGTLASTCTVLSAPVAPQCDAILPGAPPEQTSCRPVEVDIAFAPDVAWSVGPETAPGTFDLQSVAVHELGHALGLDHSTAGGSVMKATVQPGAQVRTPSEDDIAGVLALYAGPGPTPPPPPAESAEVRPPLNFRLRAAAIAHDP